MEKELLEALAGVRSPGERCQFCNMQETTPVHSLSLHEHKESCPKRRAAFLLASQGTPLKVWRVSYQTARRDTMRVSDAEQLVMRCEMPEQEALAWVHHILSIQYRQYVPGSLRIEELGIVPC